MGRNMHDAADRFNIEWTRKYEAKRSRNCDETIYDKNDVNAFSWGAPEESSHGEKTPPSSFPVNDCWQTSAPSLEVSEDRSEEENEDEEEEEGEDRATSMTPPPLGRRTPNDRG